MTLAMDLIVQIVIAWSYEQADGRLTLSKTLITVKHCIHVSERSVEIWVLDITFGVKIE